MLGEIGELLSYGGGALGIVGIVYFIIRFFVSKDDGDKIVDNIQKKRKEKVKDKQKEIDEKKKELDDLDKKAKEIQKNIDDTMDKVKKEKKEADESDSVKKTVNTIEKEW